MYDFSISMRTKLVRLRRTKVFFLCLYFIFYATRIYQEFFARTRMIRTYSSYVVCNKTRMRFGLLYVLLLVTGVRADPKYSYSYGIICMYVTIVTFDVQLLHFSSRYLVVGSRYDFLFRFQ